MKFYGIFFSLRQIVTVENIFSLIKTKLKATTYYKTQSHHLLHHFQVWSLHGSFSITWGLVRNANSWAPPQAYWLRETGGGAQYSALTSAPGDSGGYSSIRSTASIKSQGTSQKFWTDWQARKGAWMREVAGNKIIRRKKRGLLNWRDRCLMVAATDYFNHWLPFWNVKQVQI